MNDMFAEQTSPAGYYRRLEATRYLDLPSSLEPAVLAVEPHNGSILDRIAT